MNFLTLVPNIPRPSAGASATQLTDDEIKLRIRRFIEAVLESGAYAHYSSLTEGFDSLRSAGKRRYPNVVALRDEALAELNAEDTRLGRPFRTSVVLDGPELMPRRRYFDDLAIARGTRFTTEEERKAAHLRELEAARDYDWSTSAET